MVINKYGVKFKWLINEVKEKAVYCEQFNSYDVDVNINGQTERFRRILDDDLTGLDIHLLLALDILYSSEEFVDDYIEVLKIDNRIDNLLPKAEDVSGCLSEILLRKEEEVTNLSNIIEFLDTQCFYEIWLKKHNIDGETIEYQIPLEEPDRRNVIDMFREILKKMIENHNDVIDK